MRKIVSLIVLTICAAALFAGCNQKVEQKDYAPYGYEAFTGCWVCEYEEDDVKICEGIQFFSDGKCIMNFTTSDRSSCDSYFKEYYTEKDGIIRIGESLLHYSLAEDTLTLTNAEDSHEYKLWDKDINYLKELCPYKQGTK